MIIALDWRIVVIDIKFIACWLFTKKLSLSENLISDLKKSTDTWKVNVYAKSIYRSSKDNGE